MCSPIKRLKLIFFCYKPNCFLEHLNILYPSIKFMFAFLDVPILEIMKEI